MYVPLEKLIDKSNGNMYRLVHVVARRALQLADGAPKFVEAPAETKVTTLAMMEIATGKITMAEPAK